MSRVSTAHGDMTRHILAGGAVATALGLALVGSAHPGPGGVLVLAGWGLLGFGVHRFGRGDRRGANRA